MKNYSKLIDLFTEYQKTKFWKEISGDEIFKVKLSDRYVFVSIMGFHGGDLTIAVYKNKDQLQSQLDIAYGDYQFSPDSYNRIDCYELSIEKSGNLVLPETRKILKSHKLSTKKTALRLEPMHLPRLVTEEEASFLIETVQMIIDISSYWKEHQLKEFTEPFQLLHSFSKENGKIKHKIIDYPDMKAKLVSMKPIQEDLLARLLLLKPNGSYDIALLCFPFYDNETKTFPYLLLIAESQTGFIVGHYVFHESELNQMQNHILETFVKIHIRPQMLTFNGMREANSCARLIRELEVEVHVNIKMDHIFELWHLLREQLS